MHKLKNLHFYQNTRFPIGKFLLPTGWSKAYHTYHSN